MSGPHFLQLFTDFLCDFPEVRLEVQSTTRHVDLLSEGIDPKVREFIDRAVEVIERETPKPAELD